MGDSKVDTNESFRASMTHCSLQTVVLVLGLIKLHARRPGRHWMNLHGYIVLIDCSGIDLIYAIRNFYLFISDNVYVIDGVANGFSFKL